MTLTPLVTLAVLLLLGVETAAARDAKVIEAFRKAHPCPTTGLTTGPCPGFVGDHAYPLCAGGKDEIANMVWQDARASYAKDRIERELCACKKKAGK